MKASVFALFLCLPAVWAQSTTVPAPTPATPSANLPNLPDETVIAIFEDGTKFTMADFRKAFAVLPPQNQQLAMRDRKLFLQQWAFMRKLSQMGEKEKLDQTSPGRETLEYYRMMILSQIKLQAQVDGTSVDPAAVIKQYDLNKEKYKQVKVKAIYISFSSDSARGSDGKKPLTEEQAKAKADKLLTQIRGGGGDFVKLVKENSDDETSRNKDGDFATLRRSDNVPDAVRNAVFSLKQGEVSEPVRQPNGFYLLRAEEVTYRPLSQVRDELFQELKQQQYAQWLDQANRDTKVQYTSPEFLGLTPVTPSGK
jgi:parvulin-like peptidyl-prolyl isomerase